MKILSKSSPEGIEDILLLRFEIDAHRSKYHLCIDNYVEFF
jgi:hypothetical protein